ncbi:hypothetical protein [Azospirillum griseum]|jgi:hypothetical protein|uniref:Uncharacterized protein n=1 Tax=Azospirillum griseum TaxID=2496639 RepID=A0A3S0I385_9PROT|nr:hypothetical protein [Azospirillum griseum]RTR23054.1 hypothetical protein EJ903_05675 [Azospirillum griseum]
MKDALHDFLAMAAAHQRATDAAVQQARANAFAAGIDTDDEHAFAVYCKRVVRATQDAADLFGTGFRSLKWPNEHHALNALAAPHLDLGGGLLDASSPRWRWYLDLDDEGPMPQSGSGDSEGGAA